MNLKEIKELINLMNENDLVELEVDREGAKIRIKKSSAGKYEAVSTEHLMPQIIHRAESPAVKEEKPNKNLIAIKSPMVGTFYRAPAPDAKPFVEMGQAIEVGQVVCIMEAMKLMNEIKSEVKGKIVEILVENSNPVEYGQVLFMVEQV
jgi:acetyl-CoA carboxylase biotin carboxyl carrier protein